MKNKLEHILTDLIRKGTIDTHETAAIIGACTMAYSSFPDTFAEKYGTFSMEGLESLMKEKRDWTTTG